MNHPDLTNLPADVILRKSRADDETTDEIFRVHRPRLVELAELHGLNYTVVEDVVSGALTMKAGQLFGEVMAKSDRGESKVWIVTDIDRLARPDMEEMGRIIKCLQRNEVYILTPHRLYDPNKIGDLRDIKTRLFFADYELDSYKERTGLARDHAIQREGRYTNGTSPFGYTYIPGEKRYEPDPITYPILQDIWSLIPKYGMATVWRLMQEQYGDLPISWTNFARIFRNPFYAGYPCRRWKESILDDQSKWNWPEKEADYPHPITLEQWHEAQAIIARRNTRHEITSSNTWARSVLRYKGQTLLGSDRRNYTNRRPSDPKNPDIIFMRKDRAHRVILFMLEQIFSDHNVVRALCQDCEIAVSQAEKSKTEQIRELHNVNALIDRKQTQLKNLVTAYATTSCDLLEEARQVFERQIAEWNKEVELLAQRQTALRTALSAPYASPELLKALQHDSTDFNAWWELLDSYTKRQVCEAVFEEVTISEKSRKMSHLHIAEAKLRIPVNVQLPPPEFQNPKHMIAVQVLLRAKRAGITLTADEYYRQTGFTRGRSQSYPRTIYKKVAAWLNLPPWECIK